MLRRKEGISSVKKPSREEYAKVIPVLVSCESASKEEQEVLRTLEDKMKKQMERAVDTFLHSAELEDLAKFNDLMLRSFLRLPTHIRETQNGKLFFQKMARTAREIIARKRVAINVKDEPEQARLAMDASEEMGRNLDTLESSVFQLAGFIASESRVHPDRIFATGVNIDTRYGVDLVGAEARFDWQKNCLIFDLFLYQAKASRKGLTKEEVRAVATRYQGRKRAVRDELVFDADWVRRELFGRRPEPSFDFEDEKALDILTSTFEKISEMYENLQNLNSLDRFYVMAKLYSRLKVLADEFDCEVPAHFSEPRISLGKIEFRYLVDTVRGTEDLSEEEAGGYGAIKSA
jgi:hypothetical protein